MNVRRTLRNLSVNSDMVLNIKVLRSGESLKQCKQRLCQARAQAIRAGQPHSKLDKKIEYINSQLAMNSIQIGDSKPSPSKYASHAKRFSRPVQGGRVSPK